MNPLSSNAADFVQACVLAMGAALALLVGVAIILTMFAYGSRLQELFRDVRAFRAWRGEGKSIRAHAKMEERKRCAAIARDAADAILLTRQIGNDTAALNATLACRGTALRIADSIMVETPSRPSPGRLA